MVDKRKEIAAYVRNNVEFFEERLQLALNRMERMRWPLRMADDSLYSEICDAIGDWCLDKDIDEDSFDWDDLIEGDEGIIWEC